MKFLRGLLILSTMNTVLTVALIFYIKPVLFSGFYGAEVRIYWWYWVVMFWPWVLVEFYLVSAGVERWKNSIKNS